MEPTLNQPPPATIKVNRLPQYAMAGLVVVFIILVIAGGIASSRGPTAKQKQAATSTARPATNSAKALSKELDQPVPLDQGQAMPQIPPGSLNPLREPQQPQVGYYQQTPQPVERKVSKVEQARLDAEKKQKAAWESPLFFGEGSTGAAQTATQAMTPVASFPPPAQPPEDPRRPNADKKDDAITVAEGALPPYIIQAGWDIPAIMDQGAISDLPGELRARVRLNVRDTPTGRYLLIPQGSILVGKYSNNVAYGQGRVEVTWDRLQRPNKPTIYLNQMNGLSADGAGGLDGHVNNHYKKLIGMAALTTVFPAVIAASQSHGNSGYGGYPGPAELAGSAALQQASQFGMEVTRKNLNRPPTITLEAGKHFNVRVNTDLIFDQPARP